MNPIMKDISAGFLV